ncbi:MAG: hypothetical protein HRU40_19000 [Saprospiraceae bacterium]|nr:hypothetical protein [Saprospiraceae bacterium]
MLTHTKLLPLVLGVLIWTIPARAQRIVPAGIQFQMVAKEQTGDLVVHEDLFARVSLLSEREGRQVVHYSEVHEFTTNAIGQAGFIIGQGMAGPTTIDEVPWFDGNIELEVQITSTRLPNFQFYQRTLLRTVAYGFYANQTGRRAGAQTAALRNGGPNTRWLTSGNNGTQPPIHFLGSTDNAKIIFKTNGINRFTVDNSGQLKVEADDSVAGLDSKKDSYPMVISGGNQGIWININANANGFNNYLTFKDSEKIWGAVEGQTDQEWRAESEYAYQVAGYISKSASLGARSGILVGSAITAWATVTCAITLGLPFPIFAWSAPFYALHAAGVVAEGVGVGIELAAHIQSYIDWETNSTNDVGVRYHSGSADYAEWLPVVNRKEKIAFADVVGVYGSKITKKTEGADHVMIVSESPVILGNHPLDAKKEKYGRPVAFLGQVRTRVAGVVRKGDYIIPSGNNDGFGIAISPDSLASSDYSVIIGRALESGLALSENLVNVAIGLDRNIGSNRLSEIDRGLDNVIAFLSGETDQLVLPQKTQRTSCPDCGIRERSIPVLADFFGSSKNLLDTNNPFLVDRNVEYSPAKLLEQHKGMITECYAKGKAVLESKGVDLSLMPFFEQLFTNPIPILKKIEEDPEYLERAIEETYRIALEKAKNRNRKKSKGK